MKVSVRVAHQAHCPSGSKSALASVNAACRKAKCRPTYYTFHRQQIGGDRHKPIKGTFETGRRGYDKQTVERARDALQRELERGAAGIAETKHITFPSWVDEFEKILAGNVAKGRTKQRTADEYVTALRRAAEAIGHVDLRVIGATELRRVDDALVGLADATVSQHFRHLSVAFSAAVREKYADSNPVPAYVKDLGLKIPKRGKAPFEDGELARLWPAFEEVRGSAPVYRFAAQFSTETGLRLGELIALDWNAVSLTDKTVRVERTYSGSYGLGAPKGGKRRVVHMTPEAEKVLEAWIGVAGESDTGPVFPHPEGGGRLSSRNMQRQLAAAMTKAGVPKEHPTMVDEATGEPLSRSFHSFRYSTSNVMQRRGYHPRFIMLTLGHSSEALTFGVYGAWSGEQLAQEAAQPSFARTTAE
jgi:integrase